MSRTLPLRITLLAALTTSLVAQEPDAKPLTEDQRALFALLDEFDPLDTSALPFVRFEIDHGTSKDGGWGFLIARDELGFRVRTVPYGQRLCITFQRHADAVFHGSFVPATLADVEAWMLARKEEFALFGSIAADWLGLARAYARRGALADVHRLWAAIPALHGNSREQLRSEVARAAIEWFNYDFVDPAVSWQQLAARHDLWLTRFGGKDEGLDEHVQRNRAGIGEILAAKAERTKRRTNGPPTPADLVFDLHDEFWLPPPNRGDDLVCGQLPPRDGDTPLRRVKNAGLACVPDLITALDDGSFTRSVRGSARWMVTIPVGRFSDAADVALAEIAGYSPEGFDRTKAWQDWFDAVRTSSLEAVLESRIDALDRSAIARFVRNRPEGLPRVLKALRAADDPEQKHWVVFDIRQILGNPLPDALLDYLVEAVVEQKHGRWQGAAAQVLLEHGRRDVGPAVAKAWLAAVREPPTSAAPQGLSDRVRFLVECGPGSWPVLEEGCRYPRGRGSFAWLVGHMPATRLRELAKGPAGASLLVCLTRLHEDEATLARAYELEFDGRRYGLHHASIADVGAAALATCWPDEYRFEPLRTSNVRRLQRREAAWRRANPDSPVPDAPAAPSATRAVVKFDDATIRLPATALAGFRDLENTEATGERLFAAARTVARAATGRIVFVDFERTGAHEPVSIRVSVSDGDVADVLGFSYGSEGVTHACVCTTGGVSSRTSSNTADEIQQALQGTSEGGLEVTLLLRVD